MAGTTTPTITGDGTYPIERSAPWAVNYHSVDFTAGSLSAELKAAPTRDNSAIYLTHVSMGMVGEAKWMFTYDCNLTLVDGAGTNVFGPVSFETSGQTTFSKDFKYPLKITDKKALDVEGVCRSGYEPACWVYIEGFTGDKPLG